MHLERNCRQRDAAAGNDGRGHQPSGQLAAAQPDQEPGIGCVQAWEAVKAVSKVAGQENIAGRGFDVGQRRVGSDGERTRDGNENVAPVPAKERDQQRAPDETKLHAVAFIKKPSQGDDRRKRIQGVEVRHDLEEGRDWSPHCVNQR